MGKKMKKYSPPTQDSGDTAHLVTTAVLSLIPGAPELFEWFVSPPLEKRLQTWREQIGNALRELETNHKIDLKALQSDERFVSIVMQASTIAMRNYQEEKLSALQNAIVNSVNTENFKEDLQFVFIRFIDELTPSHLLLLSFFVKHIQDIANTDSYQTVYEWFEHRELNMFSSEMFRLMCNELISRGLIRVSPDVRDFRDLYRSNKLLLEDTNDDLPRIIVTEIAQQFLKFISKDK